MTITRFDPRCLGQYDEAPPLLHLMFNDGKVHRFVRMPDTFNPDEMDQDARLHRSEVEKGLTHEEIRDDILRFFRAVKGRR